MKCPKCGADNRDTANFCWNCGVKCANRKEKPVDKEAATRCQLGKSYEIALDNEAIIQIHIAINASGHTVAHSERILSKFANCSRSFYLEFAAKLDSMRGGEYNGK